VLLQCVGASSVIEPDFIMGDVDANQCYMLCCDGFRHVVGPREFFQYLNPDVCTNKDNMRENLVYLTELNKQRMENDNISAVLIRTY
jgi:serine/threonine protein phosphatase PrpC